MPTEPEIKLMSTKRRSTLFKLLFVIFLIALPFFIFYTTGYRVSFESEGAKVVTTGGIYVTADELGVDVYLDEERVDKPRLFRSAYYIQNIAAGQHHIVVQGEGLQTWVKNLPVDPYIVTEVAAFNMPELPHIRPIPQYFTSTGEAVFFAQSTSTELFPNTTTTVPYVISTRRATTTFSQNSEYDFVDDLFATSSATTTSLISRIGQELQLFQIATSTDGVVASTTVAYPYIEKGNMRLVDKGEDIFAVWAGPENSTPHYFCVTGNASSTISERYGQHVADQVEKQRLSLTDPVLIDGTRFCRTEIRLDRKWQNVKYYNFLPGSTDLVLLQLEDGLYVTEIDDRSWQNTQKVYAGDDFEVLVTDDSIYIMENGRYFELLTELTRS